MRSLPFASLFSVKKRLFADTAFAYVLEARLLIDTQIISVQPLS